MSLNFGHHSEENVGQFEGGIMGKDINMNDHNITNLPHPHGQKHAVRKKYVDDELKDKLDIGGGTMTGEIDMGKNKITNVHYPADDDDATSKFYVDIHFGEFIKRDGSIAMTDDLDMNDNKITELATPTEDDDAATKKYVDDKIAALPNATHYYHFEFASIGVNSWRQAYQLTGFIFWTNDRDIKLTILAHVFDTDNNVVSLDIHYKVIYWTKAKVKKTKEMYNYDVKEFNTISGSYLQTFGIFSSLSFTDISCFTMEYKYATSGGSSIGNESMCHFIVEYT